MLSVGVLISGRGSNLKALIDAAKISGYPAKIVCVVSNEPDAQGLERAKEAGIPAFVVNHRDYKGQPREVFEKAVDAKLREQGVQLVCMAGFMRLLTPWFVNQWLDRLINIHPSLLPAFPGLDVQRKAIAYGVKFSGCTVHFVRAEMDHGPIILQAAVPVLQDDDEHRLAARILKSEHVIYPLAVRYIAENRVNVHDERAFVTGVKPSEDALVSPCGITV
ncbi:MAG: phosphoribosylglycinamide formyltransferase [Bdellovibrionales bacterium]